MSEYEQFLARKREKSSAPSDDDNLRTIRTTFWVALAGAIVNILILALIIAKGGAK